MIAAPSCIATVFRSIFAGYQYCGSGESLQRFDKQPQYSEVNPGDDIRLDCKIFNKRGSCSWQKDNKPVGIYVKKYEWAGSQDAGDCSLWIRAATLEFDDGEWECQVTASDFTTQDALTSSPVRLVVRVAPQRPKIEHRSSQVLPGHNLTVKAGDRTTVKCLSRYGNPPARLKWFLGDEDVTSKSNQSNSPEMENPRTWVASSILDLTVEKSHHSRNLRCTALHESYPAKSQSVEVRLDVTYPPETRLLGTPGSDIEEDVDTVVLRCVTDANPLASVVWRRAGKSDISSLEESLQFRPVTRRDSGTYTCQARNSIGLSDPLTVQLDVKYPPKIVSVGPDKLTTATLFSHATFNCQAEAHPNPSYQWLQKLPTSSTPEALVRGTDSKLHIRNVTYDHQGEYVCVVRNVIGGNERIVQSEAVSLQVVGAPQVLREGDSNLEVVVTRGQDALLRLIVCADPRPRRTAWEWGSLQLEAGSGLGRYQAEELLQDGREDCYEARLHVRGVDHSDSRSYFLSVENERGADRHSVRLAVRGSYAEPVDMFTLVSIAAAGLVIFLLCVLCGVYCVRTEKCCFARRGDFRPTDLESEKSDIDSNVGRKTPRIDASVLHGPGEAMYCSTPTRRPPHTITAGGSPEAMKRHHHRHSGRSTSSSKRKRRDDKRIRAKETNLFADLQIPSVSNNGATISSTLPHRMTSYNRSYPTPAPSEYNTTAATTYFCPAPSSQRSFQPQFDVGSTVSSSQCDLTTSTKPFHYCHQHHYNQGRYNNYDANSTKTHYNDHYFSKTMPLRHSYHYQPHSMDKAEI